MGAKLTSFENRSSVEMEIRAFILPTRPDHYVSIAKIKPGETKECYDDIDPENPTLMMIYIESKFIFLQQMDVINYAKIICDINEDGILNIRYIKVKLASLRRFRGFSFCLGRD
ncbi:hypothetical protein HYC85_027469 [Camellia sinensis]|uniref:Uncharacterized protein n=1 Tax=Camellia sinensis TaxID=4442 RepID=A0A7J7G6G7_CAMSI|nr:hypothetical protein HYC85_027469 [Camellia sinensis]